MQVQEFQLGNFLRSVYLDPTSESYIGATTPLFNQTQVQVRADAGGEGGVIFDSSVAVVQGLWPVTVRIVCHRFTVSKLTPCASSGQ